MCERCLMAGYVCIPVLVAAIIKGRTKMKAMLKRIATAIRFRKTLINPWKYAYGKPARKEVK